MKLENQKAVLFNDEIDRGRFEFNENEIDIFLGELKNIRSYESKEINQENFQALCNIWYTLIARIPLPAVQIDVEWLLRARPNFNGEIFKEESDISYNKKNKSAIKANRFNRPEESVFYGTLPSDEQAKFFAGISLESYKELINENNLESVHYLTVGKWHLKENFIVVNLCFSELALRAHSGLKKIIDSCLLDIKQKSSEQSFDFLKNFWFSLSELASAKLECEQQYFITTAFFCALRAYYKRYYNESLNGLLYPSSMVNGDALNVVLMPDTVDKYLYLKEAFMYKFVRGTENKKSYKCGICSYISQVNDHRLNIEGIKLGNDLY